MKQNHVVTLKKNCMHDFDFGRFLRYIYIYKYALIIEEKTKPNKKHVFSKYQSTKNT
jgi:hypothetical protein